MSAAAPLNLFYQEPDPDRWVPFDRYPRRIIRRVLRGAPRPGGQMMVALNLMSGLDKIGVPYRFNDFGHASRHPGELACIIGKPNVLYDRRWRNPVLFGASVFSHPRDCPDLFTRYPTVKQLLVPGEWMRRMCEPAYGERVTAWPVGIDTEKWSPAMKRSSPDIDVLVYDKIRWEYEHYSTELLQPIFAELKKRGLSAAHIRYGHYTPDVLAAKLANCKAVIFLCEHETQGLAYQQVLSSGTPVLAWDRGGYWRDPSYFPDIKFGPVTSVPYWDERCGVRFGSINEFASRLDEFLGGNFKPRDYILENLTLEKAAQAYVDIADKFR